MPGVSSGLAALADPRHPGDDARQQPRGDPGDRPSRRRARRRLGGARPHRRADRPLHGRGQPRRRSPPPSCAGGLDPGTPTRRRARRDDGGRRQIVEHPSPPRPRPPRRAASARRRSIADRRHRRRPARSCCAAAPRPAPGPPHERAGAGPSRRRAALRLRQDHGDARPAARALRAAASRCAASSAAPTTSTPPSTPPPPARRASTSTAARWRRRWLDRARRARRRRTPTSSSPKARWACSTASRGEPGRTGASADIARALRLAGAARPRRRRARRNRPRRSRSAARRFDPRVRIAGVVLNRVASPRHRALRRATAIARAGLPVLGALPRDPTIALPERHLGLVQAGETADLEAAPRRASPTRRAPPRPRRASCALAARASTRLGRPAAPAALPPPGQRIALARDAAFSFVYPHVARRLARGGRRDRARSRRSPTSRRPPDCDACWLPGGYPELHAGRLAAAHALLDGLRAFARDAARSTASAAATWCWADGLEDAQGARHAMAGLLPVATSFASAQAAPRLPRRAAPAPTAPLGRGRRALRRPRIPLRDRSSTSPAPRPRRRHRRHGRGPRPRRPPRGTRERHVLPRAGGLNRSRRTPGLDAVHRYPQKKPLISLLRELPKASVSLQSCAWNVLPCTPMARRFTLSLRQGRSLPAVRAIVAHVDHAKPSGRVGLAVARGPEP